MRKVFFFLPSGVGGAERMTINIANMLDKSSFEVHFVVVGKELGEINQFIPDSYDTQLLYVRNIWDFAILKFVLFLRKNRPDVVFSSIMYLNARLVIASRIVGGVKTVIRNDNSLSLTGVVTRLLVNFSYPKADTIIAQQEEMRDELLDISGVREEKVVVFHNPIDEDLISKMVKSAESPFPLDSRDKYVCVGTLYARKGQDVLLHAFDKLHRNNPDASLYLVGSSADDAYVDKLKDFVSSHSLTDSVHFVGFQPNPYKWIANSDCLVLPSRMEGLPNVLIEAMFLNKPVVATKSVPIIGRIIRDGYNGFAVPVDDSDSLCEAMQEAISLNKFSMIYRPASPSDFCRLFY